MEQKKTDVEMQKWDILSEVGSETIEAEGKGEEEEEENKGLAKAE